jgi:hypothetical protein
MSPFIFTFFSNFVKKNGWRTYSEKQYDGIKKQYDGININIRLVRPQVQVLYQLTPIYINKANMCKACGFTHN